MTPETMLRMGLVPDHLRRLGVPRTLMSDFEFTAAVFRDSQFDPAAERPELMGGYDRRGLLNVIAWLAAQERPADAALRLLRLAEKHFIPHYDGRSESGIRVDAAEEIRDFLHFAAQPSPEPAEQEGTER